MKAFINIENDKELRDHVKQLMTGQIKSITREEITDVIRGIIQEKVLQSGDNYYFRDTLKECMIIAITNILI